MINVVDVLAKLLCLEGLQITKIHKVKDDIVLVFETEERRHKETLLILAPFRICNKKKILAGGHDLIIDTIFYRNSRERISLFELRTFMNMRLFRNAKVKNVKINDEGYVCICFSNFEIQILPASGTGNCPFVIVEKDS